MAIKIIGNTVIDDSRNILNINTVAAGNVTVTGFINATSTVNSSAFNIGTTQFANSTGVYATFVNSKTEGNLNVNNATTAYGKTEGNLNVNNATTALTANNSTNLGGVAASNYARTDTADDFAGVVTFNANAILTKALSANGGFGSAGEVLTSGGAGNVYWSAAAGGVNTAAQYAWTNTHSFSSMVTFSNATNTSNTTAAAWFNQGTGTLAFDTNMVKRISWNDGAGNFNIRAGNYYNGTALVYNNDGTSGGGATISLNVDASDGVITFNTWPIGVSGATVSGGTSMALNTTAFYVASNTNITGFANVGSYINAASFNVVGTQFANTTGVYATFMNGKTEGNLNVNAAAQLTTARNIGDVSFNGTTNIVPSRIVYKDTRSTNHVPYTYPGVSIHLKTNTTDGLADGGTYHGVLDLAQWNDTSGGLQHQLGFTDNGKIWSRYATNATAWSSWSQVVTSTSGTATAVNGNMQGAWSGTIVWNAGVNVTIAGESSFDMTSGGQFGVWDAAASAMAIRANYNDLIRFGENGKGCYVYNSIGVGVAPTGTAGQLKTSGRIYSNEWIQFDNYSGLYSPLNGAHFYPNDATYGSWRSRGSRNSWGGIEFSDASTTLMMNTDNYGFHYNGVGWRMYVTGGSLHVPGDIVAYWSDRRLKENLRPIGSEASEILSKLTAYRFNWNDRVEEFDINVKPGKEEIGLIAQEVQAVLPDAVTVNKTSAKLDSNGNQINGDYLTISWNKITPLLVQALNDTTRELNELKKLLKDKGIL